MCNEGLTSRAGSGRNILAVCYRYSRMKIVLISNQNLHLGKDNSFESPRQGSRWPEFLPHPCVTMSISKWKLRNFLALELRCFPMHRATGVPVWLLESISLAGLFLTLLQYIFLFLPLLFSLPFSSFRFFPFFSWPLFFPIPSPQIGIDTFPLGYVSCLMFRWHMALMRLLTSVL